MALVAKPRGVWSFSELMGGGNSGSEWCCLHRIVFADANQGSATCSPSMVDVARAPAKISLMRLTNMELHHVDSSKHAPLSPAAREAPTVSNSPFNYQSTCLNSSVTSADLRSPSQWHAPPLPASTPRSSPQLPPTAPRATHGHDSTSLADENLCLRQAYTFTASNGDTPAPSPASNASRARSPASASRPSHSVSTSQLSRQDCWGARVGITAIVVITMSLHRGVFGKGKMKKSWACELRRIG